MVICRLIHLSRKVIYNEPHFRTKLKVRKGEEFNLVSCHDEYSLWFDVASTPVSSAAPVTLPSPEPGLHLAMSRLRLGQVNNQQRAQVLARAIRKVIRWENISCVVKNN